jgi:hypothetical protein
VTGTAPLRDQVGSLWLTLHFHDDGRSELSVDQADPCVLICDEVLEAIAFGSSPTMWPHTTYDEASRLLRIQHRDGTLVYRIEGPAFPIGWSVAIWPD